MSIDIFRGTKRTKRVHNTSLLSDMLVEMRGIADSGLSRSAQRATHAFAEKDCFKLRRECLKQKVPTSDKIIETSKIQGIAKSNARDLASEIFGKLFEDSEKLENPTDSVHARIHRAMESTDEFKTLKDVVDGDPDFAAFATRKLIDCIYENISELMEEEEKKEQKKEEGQPDSGSPTNAERRMRRSVMESSTQLTKQIAEGKRMLGNCTGKGGRRPGNQESLKDSKGHRLNLINALSKSKKFKKVIALAGRLKFHAKAMKSKAQPSVGAVTSIERGGDLTRILPSQFAGLTHPVLRRLTLARIASGDALQYKMEEKEKEGRGPLIVLVDESGSMDGVEDEFFDIKDLKGMSNMSIANGITMALLSVALRQKRDVTVIGFTSSISHITAFKNGRSMFRRNPANGNYTDPEHFREITEIEGISTVSTREASGGTNFHRAMDAGFAFAKMDNKADIVIITDAGATLYREEHERYKNIKAKLGTRVFGIVIGGGTFCGDMESLLDESVDMNKEFTDGAGKILNATSSN